MNKDKEGRSLFKNVINYNRLSRTRVVVLENDDSPVVIEDNRGRSIL